MTDSNEQGSTITQSSAEGTEKNNISRIVMVVGIGLIAFVLLCLIFALVVSLTASQTWAPVVQIFRDIIIVIMIVELILIIGAFAILVIQIARFVIMLQTEIKPILDNARETTRVTRTTAEFVSKNAADPLIQFKSFFAGLTVFIREILNIRKIINPKRASDNDSSEKK